MHVVSHILIWNTLLHVTYSTYSGRFCPLSCDLILNYATFNDTDAWLSKKVRSCRSELRITSLYLCFAEYCKDDAQEKWIRDESLWCDENAGVTLPPFHDVVDHWTPPDRAAMTRLDAEKAMTWPVLGEVVLPEAHFFDRAFTTADVAFYQYELHLIYGWYMYYFGLVIITIGISTRLLSLIREVKSQSQTDQSIDESNSCSIGTKHCNNRSITRSWLKRYLTVPATFGNRCSQPYGWCTIPPRVQSLTIAFFIALNIVLCSCSYRLTEGNLYWPKKSMQLTRYVSDRTGIISFVNFPLVWLFGMRNDVLMWITGWGFGTYNAFHRWIARVATLQAVVHSVGYTIMIMDTGGWSHFLNYWTEHYFWNGELTTIAMCGLLAFSFYGIRRAHYEIFLVTHIVLSIVALWTMYYHVEIFTDGEWNIFIWPCLVIWIGDRILRVGRVIAFNRYFWNTRALATYDPASNMVRMEIDGDNNWIKPKPGTYYYIHDLSNILYAHQSHPFTLAYMSSDTPNASSTPLSPLTSRPAQQRSFSSDSSESDALLTLTKTPSNLVFLIRPYNGFTSRLKSHCRSHPQRIRVLIEGPYGHSEPLHNFPNTLFIVGGTGIAVPLSHLSRLLSSTSYTQSIKIVWAVRERAFLSSILREFSGLLGDERIEMDVHITQDKEVVDGVLGDDLKSVRVVTRRPDVYGAVRGAVEDVGKGLLAVVSCGPAGMADQARKASVRMLSEGYGGVEYFEESFKW
ncbi:ferric-chelate reductase-like protein [Phaeosphaeriaceae sp. PMI808]|nr:ferric-chelate reductase-like protein [Phaeosphaeriaceae sp. PMI808]